MELTIAPSDGDGQNTAVGYNAGRYNVEGVANTFIGLFTLVAAGFGVIAELFGLPAQIIFFMSLLVLAVILSFRLKKV